MCASSVLTAETEFVEGVEKVLCGTVVDAVEEAGPRVAPVEFETKLNIDLDCFAAWKFLLCLPDFI